MAAMRAWEKLRPDAALFEAIVKAIEAQRRWPQWAKDGGQFIPHPASWLNARRWEDQPPAEAAMPHDETPGRDRSRAGTELTTEQDARRQQLLEQARRIGEGGKP
jgi:hypothetical protein